MADLKDINRYLANLKDERSSAALYTVMAKHEKNEQIAGIYVSVRQTAPSQRLSVMG